MTRMSRCAADATLALMQSSVDLHVRSYGEFGNPDRHDYAQLVLPLRGAVQLDIDGKFGRLDVLTAGFVAPRAWHAQGGDRTNQSLILDVDECSLPPAISERLHDRPFTAINSASRKLIEFMAIMAEQRAAAPSVVQGWAPLLLDTLMLDAPRPASRLAALMARIEAEPGLPWATETMAKSAGVSVSRLHALFRSEHGTSPHDWLLERRLARACEWLAQTDRPIAELALRAGFSEQSALTRAMRKAMDMTPAAYRRQSRENLSK
ncbi:helix-turn-helix domain-containing protein [Pseudoduganella sp. RAF19]|uniref:helix-turn-helix domain-containing protein n=2 Tax=unclassified Pseudoduganella TaxID=2637179 RepID=UPI003F9530D7